MATVVNLKRDQFDVYIGRDSYGRKSEGWGNPVEKNKVCPECKQVHTDNGSTLPCYEKIMRRRLKDDMHLNNKLASLDGKRLGCWCKPGPCHGDILVKLLHELKASTLD